MAKLFLKFPSSVLFTDFFLNGVLRKQRVYNSAYGRRQMSQAARK